VIINPDHAPKFVGHFKAEVAHRINILFGWKKRTIWCEGYDSPVVLTPVRALVAISYLYANPGKDNLEDSIDRFPGLSSWKMYQKGEHTKNWTFVRRPAMSRFSEGISQGENFCTCHTYEGRGKIQYD
jgi:hypothetical protein